MAKVAEVADVDGPHDLPLVLARIGGWPAIYLCVAVVAFLARVFLMHHGGGLRSVGGYDDGVYYSAADALVHGRLPYKDFLLLHPPGLIVALTPFAWLGRLTSDGLGFEAARLAFMAVGAANAVLVSALLRRYGWAAAMFGGLFYALFYPAVYAERSTLLEPLGTTGILVALLVLRRPEVQRRWVFVAGLALGVSLAMKIWYVVPVLVVIAFQRRERLRLIAGAAVGGAVLYLPFFLSSPNRMFRYVVLDQLGRGQSTSGTLPVRAESILGVGHPHAVDRLPIISAGSLTLVLLALAVAAVVLAARDRSAWVFLALLVANTALLLASPSYFAHYSTLTASPLALVAGVAVGRVAATTWPVWTRVGVVMATFALLTTLGVANLFTPIGTRVPGTRLQAAAAVVPGCIMADDPTILVVMNVLSRDLSRGCPLWPDVTGWTYDKERVVVNGKPLSRARNPKWQRDVVSYLQSGNAVILIRSGTGLSKASKQKLEVGPTLARVGPFVLRGTRPSN